MVRVRAVHDHRFARSGRNARLALGNRAFLAALPGQPANRPSWHLKRAIARANLGVRPAGRKSRWNYPALVKEQIRVELVTSPDVAAAAGALFDHPVDAAATDAFIADERHHLLIG